MEHELAVGEGSAGLVVHMHQHGNVSCMMMVNMTVACNRAHRRCMHCAESIVMKATTVLMPGLRTHVDEYMQQVWLLQPPREQLRAT